MKKYLLLLAILLAGCTNFSGSEKNFGASVIFPQYGGTGTGTAPSYGQMLIGNTNGTYALVASSTLGSASSGTVTSVDVSVPTGLTIAGNPVTTSGTLALSLTSGYNIPLTASTSNWNTAYDWGNHAGLYDVLGQATSTANSILDGTLAFTDFNGNNIIEEANMSIWNDPADLYLMVASSSATGGWQWLATSSPLLNFNTGTANSGTTGQMSYYASDGTTLSGTSSVQIMTDQSLKLYRSATEFARLYISDSGNLVIDTEAPNFTSIENQLYVTSNQGGVGLGTSTPAYRLDVYGSARITGHLIFNSATSTVGITAPRFYGDLVGNALTATSDSTWTSHNSYPAACSAGQYVSQIGDTLTCGTPAGTTYTAGDYLTLTANDFDLDAEVITRAFQFLIATSSMATTTRHISYKVPVAMTITSVTGWCNTGTTTIQIDERTTPNSGGTDIMTAALAIGGETSTTSFTNAGIAAGAYVNLDIDGFFVGAPTRCNVNVKGTVVD